jgi:16S rRNA (guanine966-N2)-methyltransferase
VAPAGETTRPTADRVRQAVFDMLLHAPWAGRDVVEGATVLDAFAGTGAMGLEALSRGAAQAVFMEQDRAALAALRANIAACDAAGRVLACDVLRPPAGSACGIIFLDPPYGKDLLPVSLGALRKAGWLGPGSLIVAEIGRLDSVTEYGTLLAQRVHGAARIIVWRDSHDACHGRNRPPPTPDRGV